MQEIRSLFPILEQKINGHPLIYLDNAATTQKPLSVIDSVSNYYKTTNSNVHRGVHHLSQLATEQYEQARRKVKQFINAKHAHEVIFTRGTTESVNLIASSFGKQFLQPDDEIILTAMEHHSNIVPWQLVCMQTGAKIKVVPLNPQGELLLGEYKALFSEKTKIVSITHISNTLGTVNPIKEMINIAHQQNVPVVIDGAQGVKGEKVDVQDLDCDFYCFSGHKIYAPMGIGVLYGKESWLDKLPPYQGGGDMIEQVCFEKTTFNELPFKFEAGTPNVGGAIGLGEAIRFIEQYGLLHIIEHEKRLTNYAIEQMKTLQNMQFIGQSEQRASVVSFLLKDKHPSDVGTLLDGMGIAVRTGHHCTQPLMSFYNIPGTVRVSFAIYNTFEEIDTFVKVLEKVDKMLS